MFLTSPNKILGLDISDLSLKAVQIRRKMGGNYIQAFNSINLPPGIIEEGVIKDAEKVARLMRQLIQKSANKFTTRYAAISLPETKTFIKVIDIAHADTQTDKVRDLISKELPRHMPLEMSEVQVDWQEIGNDHKYRKFLVAAVPRVIAEEYIKLCGLAQLEVVALEIEAQAITRAILPLAAEGNQRAWWNKLPWQKTKEATNNNKKDEGAKIILDLGATRTSIILLDKGIIQFANSIANISGEKITRTIMERKNLSYTKAEKAKLICGSDAKKCKGVIRDIMIEVIDELVKEIINTINFYQDHFSGQTKDLEIILCGGGSNMNRLDEILGKKLERKILIANPLANISGELPRKIGNLYAYTTAIGLALKNMA